MTFFQKRQSSIQNHPSGWICEIFWSWLFDVAEIRGFKIVRLFGIVSESNHEFQWIFNCTGSSFENHVWNNHMLYFEGVVRSWPENDPYLLNKFQFCSTRFHHGTSMSSSSSFSADVGGQRCPDSVRIYCAVSVIHEIWNFQSRGFPNFEFEPDFDRQTPHSKSERNPDSAVRRRLVLSRTTWSSDVPDTYSAESAQTSICEIRVGLEVLNIKKNDSTSVLSRYLFTGLMIIGNSSKL